MSIKSLKAGNRNFSGLAGQVPEHHVLLQEVTVGAGGAASVTFSNIPAEYQHLQIRAIARNSVSGSAGVAIGLQFNGDTGSNYKRHFLDGYSGSSSPAVRSYADALTTSTRCCFIPTAGSTASVFGSFVCDILDYVNTTKNKTVRSLGGYEAGAVDYNYVGLYSSLWLNTNAISSITVICDSSNIVQHSKFQLFGVK